MVRIRLKRGGTKKRPFYRIVVADSREKRDGKNLEIVGIYHPLNRGDNRVQFKEDRVIDWYKKGARASDTVYQLMKKHGIMNKIWGRAPIEEPVAVESNTAVAVATEPQSEDEQSSTTAPEMEADSLENSESPNDTQEKSEEA